MSNNQNRNQSSANTPINEKVLSQMVDAQLLKAKNDAKELEIRSKEVDYQSQYANKSLQLQAELLKNRPLENRKTMTRMAYIIGGFIFLFIVMTTICLYLNKETFLLTLLKGFGYIITTLGGYWAGKKQKNKSDDTNPAKDED